MLTANAVLIAQNHQKRVENQLPVSMLLIINILQNYKLLQNEKKKVYIIKAKHSSVKAGTVNEQIKNMKIDWSKIGER